MRCIGHILKNEQRENSTKDFEHENKRKMPGGVQIKMGITGQETCYTEQRKIKKLRRSCGTRERDDAALGRRRSEEVGVFSMKTENSTSLCSTQSWHLEIFKVK
jgi:hypothetical protein